MVGGSSDAEKVKQEEIDKEIVRRDKIKNKRIPAAPLVLSRPIL
jgi:hypothetical protein